MGKTWGKRQKMTSPGFEPPRSGPFVNALPFSLSPLRRLNGRSLFIVRLFLYFGTWYSFCVRSKLGQVGYTIEYLTLTNKEICSIWKITANTGRKARISILQILYMSLVDLPTKLSELALTQRASEKSVISPVAYPLVGQVHYSVPNFFDFEFHVAPIRAPLHLVPSAQLLSAPSIWLFTNLLSNINMSNLAQHCGLLWLYMLPEK